MFSKILVALDGSAHARKAAQVAVDIALKYGARVTFLAVTRELHLTEPMRRFLAAENLMGEPQYLIDEMTKTILSQARDCAREQGLKDFTTIIREGQPARTIVTYAEDRDMDLIVMGRRGLGDVEGTLLGSVSHKVTSLATCMVLTVK